MLLLYVYSFSDRGYGFWFSGWRRDWRLITRNGWGAQDPNGTLKDSKLPFIRALISETRDEPGTCINMVKHKCKRAVIGVNNSRFFQDECIRRLQNMQAFYMDHGFSDIPWNFMIGGDGSIYEGRGHKFNGEIANKSEFSSFDGIGIHVAIIGTFDSIPDVTAIRLIRILKDFLKSAVESAMAKVGYSLFLEDQLTLASTPGKFLNELQKFDRFYFSKFR